MSTLTEKSFITTNLSNNPNFQILFTDEFKELQRLFDKHGHDIRIAGGAVRDLLMNKIPKDVDFATTATPDEMKAMFELEGVRMIHTKGESHGTVTARILNNTNFEVTTLRIDHVTDGRHAEVSFTKDWEKDAERRDLTINSMFLDFNGNLYDYFNGQEDLEKRKVRFVGNASERIQEDYLRILRFFRFFGRVSPLDADPDQETLQAIQENGTGLLKISGERIWSELCLCVQCEQAAKLFRLMFKCQILPYLGLPSELDDISKPGSLAEMDLRWHHMHKLNAQSATYFSALLSSEEEILKLRERVKFSNNDLNCMRSIVLGREEFQTHDNLDFYHHKFLLGVNSKWELMEISKYFNRKSILEELENWIPPKFPVSGKDLQLYWNLKGPKVGKVILTLKEAWVTRGCADSKETLLQFAVDQGILSQPITPFSS